jgi:hypothetical protein
MSKPTALERGTSVDGQAKCVVVQLAEGLDGGHPTPVSSMCPSLSRFLAALNDALPDAERQSLLTWAPELRAALLRRDLQSRRVHLAARWLSGELCELILVSSPDSSDERVNVDPHLREPSLSRLGRRVSRAREQLARARTAEGEVVARRFVSESSAIAAASALIPAFALPPSSPAFVDACMGWKAWSVVWDAACLYGEAQHDQRPPVPYLNVSASSDSVRTAVWSLFHQLIDSSAVASPPP